MSSAAPSTKTGSKRTKNPGTPAAAGTPTEEAPVILSEAVAPSSPAVGDALETVAEVTGPDPAQTAGADKQIENPIHVIIEGVSERIKSCMAQLKETEGMLKQLTKDTKKLCKKRAPSGKPSNLTQPLGISKELAEFLGVPPETTITRSAVTKAINEYAVASGLKLPGNGRIIKLDDRLASLLSKANGFEIPIINVQTHLREHYVKLATSATVE